MPAFCTVNGLNVLDGSIYIPRVGVWHADLSIDSFQLIRPDETRTLLFYE